MKLIKTLPLIACLGIVPAAFADPSISMYGIVDACLGMSSGITGANSQVNSGCSAGSRLGLKGTDDLGGGLNVNLYLEGGFNVDSGTLGQGGLLFGRKATVGLSGSLGDIQLGRDYAPTFYLISPIDPFALGMGTASSMVSTAARGTDVGRNNNSVIYTTPELNGFSVRTQYSMGESATAATNGGDAKGIFAKYKAGPLLVGVAYNTQANATDTGNDEISTVGVSYDLGFVKPAFLYQSGKWEGTRTAAVPSVAGSAFSRSYESYMLGVTVPFGPEGSNLLASYKVYDDKTAANFDASQITVGYKYARSPRTKLYAAYSVLNNSSKAALSVVDATTTYGAVTPGSTPATFWLGIEYSF